MYLSELKLWNFRKYGGDSFDLKKPHLTVPFNKGLNVLIGENDSGKTAIIDAIKLVLKTHAYEWIKVEDSDFYQQNNKFRIELVFKNLSENEAKNFIEWLGWEGEKENAKPILRLIYQVERNNERILPSDVRAGMDDIGYPLTAIAKDYLKTTYLKALRDADSDLIAKKNSRLAQILQHHELFKKNKDSRTQHEFETIFSNANNEIQQWFTKEAESGKDSGTIITDSIDYFLSRFIDEKSKSALGLDNPDIKTILEKLSLSIHGSQHLGLGSMNRLYMAAELLHLNKVSNIVRLGLIEELEAHLHPQAQMKVIDTLQKIENVQFILTTHSPNIASKVKLHTLILCKDNDVYPLGEGDIDVNNLQKHNKYTQLELKNYKFLEHFLDVTKANLFFAKGVIIVEGWAEQILIPVIANKLGYDLTQKEVSIINVGSTAYLHFAKIFLRNDNKKLNIPVAVVTDLDNKPDEKGQFPEEDRKNKEQSKINNFNFGEQNNIKLYLAKEWTLEWCLYKSSTLTELFKESVLEVHSKTKEYQKKGDEFQDSFEKKLIKALKKEASKLDKLEIANILASKLGNSEVNLNLNCPYLKYLIDAIKHTCRQNDDNK